MMKKFVLLLMVVFGTGFLFAGCGSEGDITPPDLNAEIRAITEDGPEEGVEFQFPTRFTAFRLFGTVEEGATVTVQVSPSTDVTIDSFGPSGGTWETDLAFPASTQSYSVTITATDAAGNSRVLRNTFVIDFTSPTVVGHAVSEIAGKKVLVVTFSETVRGSTLTTGSAESTLLVTDAQGNPVLGILKPQTTPEPGVQDTVIVTFEPETPFAPDAAYNLAVRTGIADLAGNILEEEYRKIIPAEAETALIR